MCVTTDLTRDLLWSETGRPNGTRGLKVNRGRGTQKRLDTTGRNLRTSTETRVSWFLSERSAQRSMQG